MRIAPKPKNGERMSLDTLMADPVEIPREELASWTIGPIKTEEGAVELKLASEVIAGKTRVESIGQINRDKQPWRLISGDELYGIIEFFYQTEGRTKDRSEPNSFLRELFEQKETLLMLTHISLGKIGKGQVIQRYGTPLANITEFDCERFSRGEGYPHKTLLGVRDMEGFRRSWQYMTGKPWMLRTCAEVPNLVTDYQICVQKSMIQLFFQSENPTGIALLVQTKAVTP